MPGEAGIGTKIKKQNSVYGDENMTEPLEFNDPDAMTPEEILVELKDNSELMVDLAYSALLYNNREIAEEIAELEEKTDQMNRLLQRRIIEKAVDTGEVDQTLAAIRLGSSLEVIADAAFEIANVVMRDVDPHPILKMSVHDSDAVVARMKIMEDSLLDGKTIGELRIAENTGMWLIAIKRGKKWIYGPDRDTRLKEGDIIFATGPLEGEEHLRRAATESLPTL